MSQQPNPIGRRPGNPDTRDAILTSARNLFSSQSFSNVSMRAIAADAGVDVALLAHYFGNKEGLFRAAMEVADFPFTRAQEILDGATLDDLPRRIVTNIMNVWESEELRPAVESLLRRVLADPSYFHAVSSFIELVWFGPIAKVLEKYGVDNAALRVSLVATETFGMMTARHIVKLEPLASTPPDQIAPIMIEMIEHHIRLDLPTSTKEQQ